MPTRFFVHGQPAISRVVLPLHRDAAHRIICTPFPLSPSQVERLLQCGQFPVDGAVLGILLLSFVDVAGHHIARHLYRPQGSEERFEMEFPSGFQIIQRFAGVSFVFADKIFRQFRDPNLLNLRT